MMRGEYGESAKKMVFVTVGTTSFDTLVKAVDSKQVKEELFRKGYTDLLIQTGCGSYIPSKGRGAYLRCYIYAPNEGLMHNHQSELAEELAERTPILCSPLYPSSNHCNNAIGFSRQYSTGRCNTHC